MTNFSMLPWNHTPDWSNEGEDVAVIGDHIKVQEMNVEGKHERVQHPHESDLCAVF
jgi:hypothetical protein